jgi:site-specific DNA recombinase
VVLGFKITTMEASARNKIMRLLVPIRLSRMEDNSNNPAAQRAAAQEYADKHPGTVLIWTEVEDLDVSGAMPMRERPGIGPYLTPEKINTWDGILGNEMDRISRDMLDYLLTVRDLVARGKVIIDLSDGTDTTTLRGRQTLEDRVRDAQRYREQVAEKRARAAKRIGDRGDWGGGQVRFGYMPVCKCHGIRRCPEPEHTTGWRLVRDAATSAIVRRMVKDYIDGTGFTDLARQLNASGVKAAQGRTWGATSVRYLLKSPTLVGMEVQKPHNNVVVIRRDKDGSPIRFTDSPILTDEEFQDLQDVIKDRAHNRGSGIATHLLWRVAYCRTCSMPCDDSLPCVTHGIQLNGSRRKDTPHTGYYVCKNYSECHQLVYIDDLEAELVSRLLEIAGPRLLLVPTIEHGDDHSAEIIRLERRAERLRAELDQEYDDDLERLIAKVGKQLAEILSGPCEPDRVVMRPAEPRITVAEHWAKLDTLGRNKFLRDWHVSVYTNREGAPDINLGWLPLDADTFTLPTVV